MGLQAGSLVGVLSLLPPCITGLQCSAWIRFQARAAPGSNRSDADCLPSLPGNGRIVGRQKHSALLWQFDILLSDIAFSCDNSMHVLFLFPTKVFASRLSSVSCCAMPLLQVKSIACSSQALAKGDSGSFCVSLSCVKLRGCK